MCSPEKVPLWVGVLGFLFIWLVLIGLFCCFGFFSPILHGKFQVTFGDFLYLHREIILSRRKSQTLELSGSTFVALTVQSMCAMSEIFSESINLVLWTWRDTALVQKVGHMLQNLYGVVDLHIPGEMLRIPIQATEKSPNLSFVW